MHDAMRFIFVTAALDAIGVGIILPVVPELIMTISGGGVAEAARWGGGLATVHAAMQFVFAPILGSLSDRFGRRPMLLLSLSLLCADYLLMSWAPTLDWLFVGRIVSGVTASTHSVFNACIADVTAEEKRSQGFGMLGAAVGLGFVVGPLAGGWLASHGVRVPLLAAAALTACNLLYGLLALPETLGRDRRRPLELRRANPIGTLSSLLGYPMVFRLLVAYFLITLALQSLPATWAYFTIERFHWNERQIGYSFVFVGISMMVAQALLLPIALARLRERRTAYLGYGALIASFIGYAFARSSFELYVCLALGALHGLIITALRGLMSRLIPANGQGELQGGLLSLFSLSSIVGPPLMTQLFALSAAGAAPFSIAGAAWLVAAALTAASLFTFARAGAAQVAVRVASS